MKNILILAAVAALAACSAKQEPQKTNLTVTDTNVAVEGPEATNTPEATADKTANTETPAK